MPGLDGLRALAVIAVLVYHARPGWLPGGFLGVEVFFVISGFIITRGLLTEWQTRGSIGLQAFWLRRARRLLPAVAILLAGVLAYVALYEPDELSRLRGDVLAALAYVTNWHLVLGDQSYFDSFQRPSMLRHLWSLAVEEQFYIVWPLVLAVALPILKRRGVLVLIVAGIAASAGAMALLYAPEGDNSRLYFGTDTRAAGLLVGALLAFLVSGWTAPDRWRHAVAVLGVVALAGLVAANYWLDETGPVLYQGGFLAVSLATAAVILAATQRNPLAAALGAPPLRWVGVRSYGIYLWHWPVYMLVWPKQASTTELALQVFAIVVIAAVSYALVEKPVREGALGRLWRRVRTWSTQPLSYRGAMALGGASAVAVVAALLTVALMAKPPEVPSYFELGSIRIQNVVEAQDAGSVVRGPTAIGRVHNAIAALTEHEPDCPSRDILPEGTVLGAASVPIGSTCPQPLSLFDKPAAAEHLGSPIIPIVPEPTPEELAAMLAELEPPPPSLEVDESTEGVDGAAPPPAADNAAPPAGPPAAAPPPAAEPSPAASPPPTGEPQAPPVESAAPPSPPAVPTPTSIPSVTAIGDSVMLGAAYALAGSIPGIDLDAAVGRQVSEAVAILYQRASAGQLGQVVVLHVGNNGTFTAEQFDQLMAAVGPERRVVFLNIKVPRAWEDANNAVIANGVSRYPNAVLVDWASAASTYPDLLYKDGIHLTGAGATYYAQLVVAALGG